MQTGLSPEYPLVPSDAAIKQQLAEQAYARLPFTMGQRACQELFENFSSFVGFCFDADDDRFVRALTYKVNDVGNGVYYLDYREPGQIKPSEPDRPPGTDHKYTFQYGPQTIDRATEALGGALPTEMRNFLENCDEFYEAGTKVLRIGAAALGLEQSMFAADRRLDVHVLRLLDYLATDAPSLGAAHFDRSWLTAPLSESSSGLRGVGGQNGYLDPVSEMYINQLLANLRPIDYVEHEAKLWLGAGINRLPEQLRAKLAHLPLLAHDITNDHVGESRQSAAAFGNPHQRFVGYPQAPDEYETGLDKILERFQSDIGAVA